MVKKPKPKRLKKQAIYKSFAWQKTLPPRKTNLKSSWSLLLASWHFLKANWQPFSYLALVILAIGLSLLWGILPDLEQEQDLLRTRWGTDWRAEIAIALTLLPEVIGHLIQLVTQSLGEFTILGLCGSLALWWLIRQLQSSKTPTKLQIRDAFYFGPAQLIPFGLLCSLLFLQLLPALIVSNFATELRTNEVLQTNLEQAGAVGIILIAFGLSFYWLAGGLFSLIIVSLPRTRPLQAWQTSLSLVQRRRWPIISHLLVLGVVLILLNCLLVLPFVWLWPQGAHYIFYFLTIYLVILGHIYWFLLYQQLLAFKDDN